VSFLDGPTVSEALGALVITELCWLIFGFAVPRNDNRMRGKLGYLAYIHRLLLACIELIPAFLAPVDLCLVMRMANKTLKRILCFILNL
jgi:hypothetical protein